MASPGDNSGMDLSFVPSGVLNYLTEHGQPDPVGLRPSDENNNIGGGGWQYDNVVNSGTTNHAVIAADAQGSAYYAAHPGAMNGVSDAAYAAAQAGSGWAIGSSGQRVYVGGGNSASGGLDGVMSPSGVGQGGTQAQRNSLALIQQNLANYNLPPSLADWAWNEIVAGKGQAEIMLDLQQRPEYKQAFPEIEARQKAGLAPMSPGDVVNYRQQAGQMMRAAGLPAGFYDSPQDFTDFLTKDVSLSELSSRVTMAANAAFKMPAEDRAALASYGVGPGELTAFWLDPDKAQPLLERKYAAAQLSGAATRSGFGALSENEASALTQQGVSTGQAQQGFGQLASSSELFNPLDNSDETIGRQDQIDAVFGGNANAARRIEQQRRRRQATFEGGGSFAAAQTGVSGLGAAPMT